MLYYKQTFDKIKLSGWLYMNEIIVESDIQIENMIYEVRGKQVMLDSDVAKLFGYETKYLNRQVQRNINRFPEKYCFKLKVEEYEILRCQNVTLNNKRGEHKKYMPYVFTEYGVTMLAGILKSEIAVVASLKIVDAFIKMRHYISSNLMEKSILTIGGDLIIYQNVMDILLSGGSIFLEKVESLINGLILGLMV